MQHYHVTDIQHAHGITDPGHIHGYERGSNNDESFAGAGAYRFFYTYSLFNTYSAKTGITINSLAENERYRRSGGSIDSLSNERTQTDSNNSNANENRPENFTIKIWKRTA